MSNINELKNFYEKRTAFYSEETKKYKSKVRNTNIFRGLSFIFGAVAGIVFSNFSLYLMLASILISLIFFVYFVYKNSQFLYLRNYNKAMKEVNENELKSLDNDNSAFDCGDIFVDKNHKFSYDLDIFGNNSIFQKVNRTVTKGGYNFLAEIFRNPLKDISKILEIQKNTSLLAPEVEVRQNFMALGKIFESELNSEHLGELRKQEIYFTKNNFWKILSWVLISSTIVTILLSVYDVISYFVPLFLYLVQQTIVFCNQKKTQEFNSKIDKNYKAFKKYYNLFLALEKLPQVPEKFRKMSGNYKISTALKEFANITGKFEQRHNFMFAIFAQGIFLYDILLDMKLEKLLKKYSSDIENWFEMSAEYDFLFSLANLQYNNPDWNFPNPVEQKFVLEAKNAGHPLIKYDRCVKNNIQFSDRNYLIILTGANMAGKSTYLRTIGTNLILAQIGAVVCAESFTFSPVEMFTSIRTNDSVQNNESYFFAELKRLHQIIEKLESGETLFVIVDEMLRGTNSKDKHDGSQNFVKKLLKFNCYGIFATHDIDIGNMQSQYPENIDTKCFEISFEGDNLIFDYKLKNGISQNLNATYLMKKMGIID